MEPPWDGGTKLCSKGPCHMTKLATTPIYGKKVCSNDDPELTLIYFTARSNLVPYAFVWEKGKTMDFSETVVVFDLKLTTDDLSDKKEVSVDVKTLSPGAISPLPRGIIHVINHEKKNV